MDRLGGERNLSLGVRMSAGLLAASAVMALLSSSEAPPTAAFSRCAAPPDTAEGWSDLMRNVQGWKWGDGISSTLLPNGAVIISGGDNWSAGTGFKRNALISVCGDKAKAIIENDKAFLSKDGQWYWPGEMIVDEAQGKLYIFANRMAKTRETSDQNGADLGAFTGRGIDMAVFLLSKSAGDDPQFLRMADTPASNNPEVDADGMRRAKQWGASVVQGNDGYVYVYGSLMETRLYNVTRDAYVARVPLDKLESPADWQYFSASGWSHDEAAATSVIDSQHQPGLDVTWTTWYEDNLYKIVSKRDGIYGTELGLWSSPTPTGPFTYRKLADLAPFNAEAMTYNAHAHPKIALKSGGMLISICQNTNRNPAQDDPAKYRPQWRELAL